ncbi:hypothetical protein BJ508DRAFT_411484 [Ascobolus immersus RN42]|uniref:Uncharacterized protein n=1 Tax=Ascobolus immersus RN42 TaxID=1160509 RepID=A0A3N4IKY2_ASCIM|nr:hypothetical protein BJ508DRAFT_411484 [Ascobolus immersus RN42]
MLHGAHLCANNRPLKHSDGRRSGEPTGIESLWIDQHEPRKSEKQRVRLREMGTVCISLVSFLYIIVFKD